MMRPLRMGVRASEGLRASVRDPAALRSPLPMNTPPEVRVSSLLDCNTNLLCWVVTLALHE